MSSDHLFHRPDPKFEAMVKEEEILRTFEDVLSTKAKELINQHYPNEINRLSSQGYLELEAVISRNTANLAAAINTVMRKYDEG